MRKKLMSMSSTEAKHILTSKTFWINIIIFLSFFMQQKWGFVLDESSQLQLLALVNIILRAITDSPVRWK